MDQNGIRERVLHRHFDVFWYSSQHEEAAPCPARDRGTVHLPPSETDQDSSGVVTSGVSVSTLTLRYGGHRGTASWTLVNTDSWTLAPRDANADQFATGLVKPSASNRNSSVVLRGASGVADAPSRASMISVMQLRSSRGDDAVLAPKWSPVQTDDPDGEFRPGCGLDVAVRPGFPPSERAEQSRVGRAVPDQERVQFASLLGEEREQRNTLLRHHG